MHDDQDEKKAAETPPEPPSKPKREPPEPRRVRLSDDAVARIVGETVGRRGKRPTPEAIRRLHSDLEQVAELALYARHLEPPDAPERLTHTDISLELQSMRADCEEAEAASIRIVQHVLVGQEGSEEKGEENSEEKDVLLGRLGQVYDEMAGQAPNDRDAWVASGFERAESDIKRIAGLPAALRFVRDALPALNRLRRNAGLAGEAAKADAEARQGGYVLDPVGVRQVIVGDLRESFRRAFQRNASTTRSGPFERFVGQFMRELGFARPEGEAVRNDLKAIRKEERG